MKIFSENLFSGKTYFFYNCLQLRRLMDRGWDHVGGGAVVIYVPWAVFRELDALKSRWELI